MPTSTAELSLADPDDHPSAAVVIYDGHCRFCQQQVKRLARWDGGHGRLAFLSLHDSRVADLCPELTYEQLMQQMYLLAPDGRLFGGASVMRYLSRLLPRLWPLAPLLHIPGSLAIWQWCYRQVARQRYRWGRTDRCDTGGCDIHFK